MSAPGFEPMAVEDAAAFFKCSSERFGELAALFDAIAHRIPEHDGLRKLATLGKDAGLDYENLADCWREQIEKGGVRL